MNIVHLPGASVLLKDIRKRRGDHYYTEADLSWSRRMSFGDKI